MQVSRRSFLKYCAAASATLGLGPAGLISLRQVLGSPSAPSVLWIQGSGCSGCTVSFLNYVAPSAPRDASEVLIHGLNLVYHPTLSAGAGEAAVSAIRRARSFLLVVEGGVPTSFGGHACTAWSDGAREVTFQQAVQELAAKATQVVCVGACASYGGVSAMGSNPAGVRSVREFTKRETINVAGCPPHPDAIVWTLAQLLQGISVQVDAAGRPLRFYGSNIHEACPNHGRGETRTYGVKGRCLEALGCRRRTFAPCPELKWNNGVNWCIGAGAPCIGCADPAFPNAPAGGRGRRGQANRRERG